ncbi:MAG: fbpA 1 [Herminiimonas sp.]|nr:fbpA 1 [Herminiimonas sp.]
MNSFLRRTCLLSLLLISNVLPAWAQSAQVANVASYEGADRQQRLIAEAKKEGSLTLYTSITAANLEILRAGFEKKYGIKLNVWRAGDDKVIQRILTEKKVNRASFDIVHVNSLEMEALHRENALQRVNSPYINMLIPVAVPPHKEWVATFLNIVVQAYNTDKIKKADLPKTYQDLLDPKWKGRLGIEANDQEWFYAVIRDMGTEKGLKFFKDLVSTNGISVRTGHSLLNNMVVSGDVPLALTVYGHMPLLAQKKGAPIDWFALEPAIALPFGIGLSKTAPHPNAAVLFYDYMLSDGQKLLSQMHYIPTNKDTESSFKNLQFKVVDKAVFLDEYEKWTTLYENIVLKAK